MWNLADDALLAGLAAGDAAATEAFVARFQRRVFGLALVMTGDRRTAEDVAQEALLRAWRHGATYDARRGSVTTWLLTITRNLAIDSMRVRRPVPIEPDAFADLMPASSERDPGDLAGATDDAARVHAAVATLPEDQRRAVVLAGLLGRSAREVSEIEGIPLGTAKTRIRTAMLRLRTLLTNEERAE